MRELEGYYKHIGIEERLIGGNMTYKPSPAAFLGTADPNVFVNATRLHPQYRFTKSPYESTDISRASREGVEAISYVVNYLANCDFVVCNSLQMSVVLSMS